MDIPQIIIPQVQLTYLFLVSKPPDNYSPCSIDIPVPVGDSEKIPQVQLAYLFLVSEWVYYSPCSSLYDVIDDPISMNLYLVSDLK